MVGSQPPELAARASRVSLAVPPSRSNLKVERGKGAQRRKEVEGGGGSEGGGSGGGSSAVGKTDTEGLLVRRRARASVRPRDPRSSLGVEGGNRRA